MTPMARGGSRLWLALGAGALLLMGAAARGLRPALGSLVALEAEDVAAACALTGAEPLEFWERAQAMGVGAMVLRPQTLGDLCAQGKVLVFPRPELEKWRSVGLIAAGAALKPNVLWIKDVALFARAAEALRGQGLVASTATASGHGLIELKRDPDPGLLVGEEPAALAAAASAGVIPLRLDASGQAASPGKPRAIAPSARLPTLLRACYGQPGRPLILRLDASAGAEENLSRLRGLLRPLRERGLLAPGLAAAEAPAPEALPRWRRWLAWLLAVLAPIAAVRLGVQGFKQTRRQVRAGLPVAAPVPEILLGALAVAAAAAAGGCAAGLLLAGGEALPLAEVAAFSTMVWPLAIGALGLYPLSAQALRRRLRNSPTYGDLLRAAAVVLAAALLFRPRQVLAGTPLWDWLQRAADGSPWAWWWPWRWREFLVGLPALMRALCLVGRRLDAEDPHARRLPLEDPRPWLWLGLLFPIGTLAALGRSGASGGLVLAQTGVVLAAGLSLGGLFLLATAAWETWGPGSAQAPEGRQDC